MNTKEMVEHLPSLKDAYFEWNVKYGKEIKLTKIKMNEHIIDETINLLERGEKYEQIFNELENCLLPEQYKVVEKLEQKYFPKK